MGKEVNVEIGWGKCVLVTFGVVKALSEKIL